MSWVFFHCQICFTLKLLKDKDDDEEEMVLRVDQLCLDTFQ